MWGEMANQFSAGTLFVDKRDILNSMRAVFINLSQQSHLMRDDPYTLGYQEGFEHALTAIAATMGVEDEFEDAIVKQKTHQFFRMRVVSNSSSQA